MSEYRLGEVETKFADIIWQNAPLSIRTLVEFAEEKLGWKRTTTYTILGRLCDKGIFLKDGKIVSMKITKDELVSRQSEKFVEDTFSGSLPKFLAAFSRDKKLTDDEICEIQALIDKHKGV